MIYHKDVFLPRRIKGMVPQGVKNLFYSRHAKQEFSDKNGQIVPPDSLNFAETTVVEVTVHGNMLDKLVLRKEHDENNDIVIVCVPCIGNNKKNWFVKTVWLNRKNDNHRTLNRSVYVQSNQRG